MFKESFVEEVLINVTVEDVASREDDPKIDQIEILKAPNNSLIVREVASPNEPLVAYPFFPAHLMLPVRTGDHVWTFTIGGQLYWMCGKVHNSEVDDLSATWAERAQGSKPGQDNTAEQQERASSGTLVLPRVKSPIELAITSTQESAEASTSDPPVRFFDDVISEKRKHVPEVVPRFKKRPADLAIQGSNNTLISLGTDRGFKKEDSIDPTTPSSAFDSPEAYRGTIDIVTGRGRYIPKVASDAEVIGNKPLRTAPPTIMNEYGDMEVDKDPIANEIADAENRSEGDPDFGFDASRIYISSKTKIDENFSLSEHYSQIPAVLGAGEAVPENVEAAAIAIKSDEIRIIARKHVAEDHFKDEGSGDDLRSAEAVDVNGSIKIIKEGTRDGTNGHSTTDGNGAAVIMIQPDGTIMIDGPTVVIGSGREESNGAGDQVFIGTGATEPIVLGTQLHTLLDTFFTDLKTFLSTKFDTHIHPTGVGPSGPPTVTGDDAGCGSAQGSLDSFLSKVGKTR